MTNVFVFGSNEAGVHGAGAAAWALKHRGAEWGVGYGHRGDSFALPTKDRAIRTLPIERIKDYVAGFLHYAAKHPKLTFELTPVGCGLAGYKHAEIAPLFAGAPANVIIPQEFKALRPELDEIVCR